MSILSSEYTKEMCTMHSKSDNKEIVIGSEQI